MPLVNRDKDQSEQRDLYQSSITGTASGVSAGVMNPVVATGQTYPLCVISRPGQLIAAGTACWGISGTPNHNLWVYRFAGGFTSILVGASLAPTAFGTSGYVGYSMAAASISFPLQTGDQIVLNTTGSNAAFASVQIALVVKALQDIKSDFGV